MKEVLGAFALLACTALAYLIASALHQPAAPAARLSSSVLGGRSPASTGRDPRAPLPLRAQEPVVARAALPPPIPLPAGPAFEDPAESLPLEPSAAQAKAAEKVAVRPRGLSIAVRRAGDGASLAGVEIEWLDPGELFGWEWENFQRGDIEGAFRARAGSTRGDARGRALLPPLEPGSLILGRRGGLWGLAVVPSDPAAGITLALGPARVLRVQTVAASGEPLAGIPLAIVQRAAEGDVQLWSGRSRPGDGVAAVRHLPDLLRLAAGGSASSSAEKSRLFLAPAPPFAPRPRIELDPRGCVQEPLRLALAPVARLHLRIGDAAGQPLGEPAVVFVESSDPAGADRDLIVVPAPQRIEGGRGTFAVPAGAALEVRVLPASGIALQGSWRGRAPDRAGEEIEVAIRLEPPRAAIRLLLVDERAAPLGAARLKLRLGKGGPGGGGVIERSERCDDQGRLALAVSADFPAEGGRVLRLSSSREGLELKGEIVLPRVLAKGINDLGRVTLAPDPLLLSGWVVDDAGDPIAGAEIRARYLDERASAESERIAIADDQGRFEVRGPRRAGTLRLEARVKSHARATLASVPAGARELRLVCPRVASLEAALLWDEALAPALVRAEVLYPDGRRFEGRFDERGKLDIQALALGTVTLRLLSGKLPLLSLAGIVLRHPEGACDERLQSIDLRGRMRSLEMVVRGPGGTPLARRRFHILLAGCAMSGAEEVRSDARGHLVLAVPRTLEALWIASERHRLARVATAGRDQVEVNLAEGLGVRIQPEIATPGWEHRVERLRVRLRPRAFAPEPELLLASLALWADLDGQGGADLVLPAPGSYELIWLVERRGQEGFQPLTAGDREVIEVAERAGSELGEVRVPFSAAQRSALGR